MPSICSLRKNFAPRTVTTYTIAVAGTTKLKLAQESTVRKEKKLTARHATPRTKFRLPAVLFIAGRNCHPAERRDVADLLHTPGEKNVPGGV